MLGNEPEPKADRSHTYLPGYPISPTRSTLGIKIICLLCYGKDFSRNRVWAVVGRLSFPSLREGGFSTVYANRIFADLFPKGNSDIGSKDDEGTSPHFLTYMKRVHPRVN